MSDEKIKLPSCQNVKCQWYNVVVSGATYCPICGREIIYKLETTMIEKKLIVDWIYAQIEISSQYIIASGTDERSKDIHKFYQQILIRKAYELEGITITKTP